MIPALYQQLRKVLLRCGPFGSDRKLRAIFADPRLQAWQPELPEATNKQGRVDLTIDFLLDKYSAAHENGLISLLHVLHEETHSRNLCQTELRALINAFEQQLELPVAEPPIDLKFITIPADEFLMGSNPTQDPQANSYETPQHPVYLSTYQISQAPITNEQYDAFVQTGHRPPQDWRNGRIPKGKNEHPVVGVSWDDAKAFCRWLSNQTRQFHRLPTEAEWEKAARGTNGQIYPWGNQWDSSKLNYVGSGAGDTTPVGRYFHEGDSPYGLVDLCGNVWEWCLDWFQIDIYASRRGFNVKNPHGPKEGENRSIRGSAWFLTRNVSRPANRFSFPPYTTMNGLGFRCIREVNNEQ